MLDGDMHVYNVAQKLSWASERQTTRVEDEAYCLMGIFNVNMPLIYGEGRKALQRLQQEILSQSEDLSFLLWTDGNSTSHASASALATSTRCFPRGGPRLPGVISVDYLMMNPFSLPGRGHSRRVSTEMYGVLRTRQPTQMTGRGLRVQAFVGKAFDRSSKQLLTLLWTEYQFQGSCICIAIATGNPTTYTTYHRIRTGQVYLVDHENVESWEMDTIYLQVDGYFDTPTLRQLARMPVFTTLSLFMLQGQNPAPHTIELVRTCPLTPLNWVPGHSDLHSSHDMAGVVSEEILQSCRTWSLKLLLKIKYHRSGTRPMASSSFHLVVAVLLRAKSPRCWVALCGENNWRAAVSDAMPDSSTDRAECESLDGGSIIRVKIKASTQADTQWAKQKSLRFSVHITSTSDCDAVFMSGAWI